MKISGSVMAILQSRKCEASFYVHVKDKSLAARYIEFLGVDINCKFLAKLYLFAALATFHVAQLCKPVGGMVWYSEPVG